MHRRMRIIDLQGPTQYIETKNQQDLKLQKTVFVGYTDISAAGSRALMGLDMRLEFVSFPIPGLESCVPSCVRDIPPKAKEREFTSLQIIHCKYEQFSAILINTWILPEKAHIVANAIIDLCIKSGIEKLIMLTTLLLDKIPEQDQRPLYENTFFTRSITNKLPLSGSTMIRDIFLSTFLQMVQAIKKFQEILHKYTNLCFNEELSLSLIYRCDEERDSAGISSLYA